MKVVRWSDEEDQLLRVNYTFGLDRCCVLLPNRTIEGIKTRLFKLGVRLTTEQRKRRMRDAHVKVRSIDIKMFKSHTPETSYLLGLWWADGSIKNGNNTFMHGFSIKDSGDFIPIYKKTGEWKFTPRSPSYFISGGDADFYDFLCKLDYHIKSGAPATKVLEFIPRKYHHYWWRGYFDGDGYISKKINCICFTSTYNQDWSFIFSAFPTLDFRIEQFRDADRSGSCAKISRRDTVQEFIHYIYNGYNKDKIGLKRKYEIAVRYLE